MTFSGPSEPWWAFESLEVLEERKRDLIYPRRINPLTTRPGLPRYTNVRGNSKSVDFDELLLSETILVAQSNIENYGRTRGGRWVLEGSSGIGLSEVVGFELSKVTSDAAWYNTVPVELTPKCSEELVEQMWCAGGGCRTCKRCLHWKVRPVVMSQRYGIGYLVANQTTHLIDPVECSKPCPSVDLPPAARRAQNILKGLRFTTEAVEDHPFVFRTRVACMRYRNGHPMSEAELHTW